MRGYHGHIISNFKRFGASITVYLMYLDQLYLGWGQSITTSAFKIFIWYQGHQYKFICIRWDLLTANLNRPATILNGNRCSQILLDFTDIILVWCDVCIECIVFCLCLELIAKKCFWWLKKRLNFCKFRRSNQFKWWKELTSVFCGMCGYNSFHMLWTQQDVVFVPLFYPLLQTYCNKIHLHT